MVKTELLNLVKDYLNVTVDDFDIELKIHINGVLSKLEVNNINYNELEDSPQKRLIENLIQVETYLKFDKSIPSNVQRMFEQEKTNLWYLVLAPIYD